MRGLYEKKTKRGQKRRLACEQNRSISKDNTFPFAGAQRFIMRKETIDATNLIQYVKAEALSSESRIDKYTCAVFGCGIQVISIKTSCNRFISETSLPTQKNSARIHSKKAFTEEAMETTVKVAFDRMQHSKGSKKIIETSMK